MVEKPWFIQFGSSFGLRLKEPEELEKLREEWENRSGFKTTIVTDENGRVLFIFNQNKPINGDN